jgi:hypothetical protein
LLFLGGCLWHVGTLVSNVTKSVARRNVTDKGGLSRTAAAS